MLEEKRLQSIKEKGIDASVLKYIAIIAMLIDRIGVVLVAPMLYEQGGSSNVYAVYEILRNIGRLAFPIFCFFLLEGFYYTRDVKKYALRLFLFALISEIPFDLAFWGGSFKLEGQNVYFTLLIGLGVMAGFKYIDVKGFQNEGVIVAAKIALTAIGCLLAVVLKTDYNMYGVLSRVVLHMYRLEDNRLKQLIMGAITFHWEPWALMAFPLLYLYNGERGRQPKYLFYGFYPVHILVLYLISKML